MKSLSILFLSFLLAFSSQAQSVNTLMFGGNVLSASVNSFDRDAVYAQSLQVKAGFFATDRLAIGLNVEAGINGNKTVPYGITLFSRWYAGKKEHQTIKFFVEAGAGIADNKYTTATDAETFITDKNWIRSAAYISPGINIFAGKVLAFELAPEYRYIGGPTNLHRLGISAGVRIFLTESLFKQTFPEKFKTLN